MTKNYQITYKTGTLVIKGKIYTVIYEKGSNVSTIGKTSDTCTTSGTSTSCSVTLPNITTNTGYTASGWYNGTTKAGNAGASYSVSGNTTLTAKATANTYSIGYTLNGGSYGTSHPTSGTYDSNVNINNPKKTITITGNANSTGATVGSATSKAQTFAGWTADSNLSTSTAKYGTSTSVTNSWSSASTKVTAEYFKNLRTTSGTVTLTANWTPVAFNTPTITKTGYKCGWATSSSATSYTIASGGTYTPTATTGASVTLYGVCTVNSYDVNLSVVNGTTTGAKTKKVSYNNTTTFTGLSANTGYGNPTVSCTNGQTATISGSTVTTGKITSDTTCTVTYAANTYQVKYNTNGGTAETKEEFVDIFSGATITSDQEEYWKYNPTYNALQLGGQPGPEYAVIRTTEFEITDENSLVTFHAELSQGSLNYKIYNSNNEIVYDDADPANTFENPITISLYDKGKYTLEIELQTEGTAKVGNFTIEAPSSMSNSKHTYDTAKSLSKNIYTKTGYTFLGWSKDKNATTATYTDEESVKNLTGTNNETVNLYAIWEANKYTVKYNANGGRNVSFINQLDFEPTGNNESACKITYENGIYTKDVGNVAGGCIMRSSSFELLSNSSSPITLSFVPFMTQCLNVQTCFVNISLEKFDSLSEKWSEVGVYKVQGGKESNFDNLEKGTYRLIMSSPIIVGYSIENLLYYDNQSIDEPIDDSSYVYDTSKKLTKNIYTRKGYTFLGWSKDKNATTATYTDEESVKNLTGTNNETVNLYAIWKLKSKKITFETKYDTSSFSGPSTSNKTSEKISKTSTNLSYGSSEIIKLNPATPVDRYKVSVVRCTNNIIAVAGNIASSGGGSSPSEYSYSIEVMNNSDTTTASVCTITYVPKWEGVATGTYTTGATMTYAGKSWTVKSDNGEDIGLVLNETAGTGPYKSDVKSELNNAKVNTDVSGGGILPQSSNVYVTTDGGINTNYSSFNQLFWIGNGKAITPTEIKKYTLGSDVHYSAGHKNQQQDGDGSTTTYWTSASFPVSVTSAVAYSAGSTISATATNSSITFSDANATSTSQGKMGDRYMAFQPQKNSSHTPSSSKMPVRRWTYDYATQTYPTEASYITQKTLKLYDCGNAQHGKAFTLTAKSSTNYTYTSQNGNTSSPKYATSNTTGWRWYWASAVDGTVSNSVRTYRLDTSPRCLERTKYSTSDVTKNIYYRPYLIVRER